VNVVRKEEVAVELRAMGAEHVVVSSKDTYKADLLQAIKATEATLAFEAIGGGDTTGDILTAMVGMLAERDGLPAGAFYGPTAMRQVYRYGNLEQGNTTIPVSLGPGSWSVGGWLMPFHYAVYGEAHLRNSIDIVLDDLKDTFATKYSQQIKMDDVAGSVEKYFASMTFKTGEKTLVLPNGDL